MPNFKTYNQNQQILLPLDINDWVPPGHIARAVNDIVDSLDINCIKSAYSENGCPAYNPRMLIKLIFFSYTKTIRSSRKIEELANENIVFRYLSANQCPDHGTINLFRKRHLSNLEDIFSQIVILAGNLKMINPEDISIDGSIFRANASKKEIVAKKDIKNIKKKIRRMLEEANEIDREEDRLYGSKGYNEMPEDLIDLEQRKKKIKELMEKMKKVDRAEKEIQKKQEKVKTKEEKNLSRNTTYNCTDPEARLMKIKNSKSYKPAYNGQIAASNQIITAYDITDENVDGKMLIPMIEKTEKNTETKVKTVKADSIYFNRKNIDYTEKEKIDAYIPDQLKAKEEKEERNNEIPKYDRRNFKYDQGH